MQTGSHSGMKMPAQKVVGAGPGSHPCSYTHAQHSYFINFIKPRCHTHASIKECLVLNKITQIQHDQCDINDNNDQVFTWYKLGNAK